MKYLSVLILIALLSWSWAIVNSKADVPYETHAALQEKLADLLVTKITDAKGTVQNVRINDVWTEVEGTGKLVAHYSYSFQEPTEDGKLVAHTLSGSGILSQTGKNDDGTEQWAFNQLKTEKDEMEFQPETITVNESEKSEAAPAGELPKEAAPAETTPAQ